MSNDEQNTGTALATKDEGKAPAKRDRNLSTDGGNVMAIVPRSLDEASRYAQGLIAANQVPDAFRYDGKKGNDANPSLVVMGLLKVLELGLPPQTGLGNILPLNGRFTVWGDGALALLQRPDPISGETVVADYKVEWINKPENWDSIKHQTDLKKWPANYGCRVSIWRKGQKSPYIGEYTVADASRAGLWNSQYRKPWIQHPERMLLNRARAFAMRDGFADRLMGLGIAEEVMDTLPAQGTRRGSVDNSMLDDDLPLIGHASGESDPETRGERVAEYLRGLQEIDTLERLAEYQSEDSHRALIAELQDEDERLYQQIIAANAGRYQAIEAAEREDDESDEAEIEEIDEAEEGDEK